MPKAEGKTFSFLTDSHIQPEFLETIPFTGEEKVTLLTREFNAVCPFSGLPDFGELQLEYVPDGKIIELKSFKYYLTSFRNIGIYQEMAAQRIYRDFHKAVKPKQLYLKLTYNSRGGIDCVVEKGDPIPVPPTPKGSK